MTDTNPTPPDAARVEALARVLAVADGAGDMLGLYGSWEATPTVFQAGYLRMARAALAAEGERTALVQELASVTRHRDILLSVTTDPVLMDQVYQSLQDEREGRQPVPFRDIQRLAAVERERDALREALAEVLIPFEGFYAAMWDSKWLAPGIHEEMRRGLAIGRAAIMAGAAPTSVPAKED